MQAFVIMIVSNLLLGIALTIAALALAFLGIQFIYWMQSIF